MVMILTVPLGTAYTDHLTRPGGTGDGPHGCALIAEFGEQFLRGVEDRVSGAAVARAAPAWPRAITERSSGTTG
ncbi:hypothetical protein MICRO116_140001 [Micrococcus sp. 116]|nr:hypothetical protein MICRO116_140001 [Micrococcus sp. 116]